MSSKLTICQFEKLPYKLGQCGRTNAAFRPYPRSNGDCKWASDLQDPHNFAIFLASHFSRCYSPRLAVLPKAGHSAQPETLLKIQAQERCLYAYHYTLVSAGFCLTSAAQRGASQSQIGTQRAFRTRPRTDLGRKADAFQIAGPRRRLGNGRQDMSINFKFGFREDRAYEAHHDRLADLIKIEKWLVKRVTWCSQDQEIWEPVVGESGFYTGKYVKKVCPATLEMTTDRRQLLNALQESIARHEHDLATLDEVYERLTGRKPHPKEPPPRPTDAEKLELHSLEWNAKHFSKLAKSRKESMKWKYPGLFG